MTVKTYKSLKFIGPDLSEGPLPTLFYFALSAEDSLELDPFNQPVVALQDMRMRIFSATIPGHENKMPATEAIDHWIQEMDAGNDILAPFFEEVVRDIESLHKSITTCGVAGLSRGAFIGAHVAARMPDIQYILGFAPLTRFEGSLEIYNLDHLVDKLSNRTLRFYIGNRDTRVGTDHCFEVVQKLAEDAYQKRISSAPIEFFVGPSIGYLGHGTSPEIFKAGAQWIYSFLQES